jgi:hypothetical protein
MPIWGQQLTAGQAGRYRALVVPGCPCLSDEEIDAITAFATEGGVVVIGENSGVYNEYHQLVDRWRFAHLFESGRKGNFRLRFSDRNLRPLFARDAKRMSSRVGQGRAIYLPKIRATREPIHTYDQVGGYDLFTHVALPKHWRALPRTVEKALGRLSLKVEGPWTVACELLRKAETGQCLVHLVNYAEKKAPTGVEIVLADRPGKARLYLPPEQGDGRKLKATKQDKGEHRLRLPGFDRYALLVIEE